MSSYVKSFIGGMVWGAAEGVAEGMTGAHVKAKKKKSNKDKNKKKRRSNKGKKKRRSNKNKRHDEFIKKKRNAGLRPGDPKRSRKQLTELYHSLPADIRYNPDDQQFWKFVDSKEFGHQKSYKNSNDNSITNMIWQDTHSNRRLGANDMDPKLLSYIKQQNAYNAKSGENSKMLQNLIDSHLDSQQTKKGKSNTNKNKRNKKKNKKNKKTDKHKNKTKDMSSSDSKPKPSGTKILFENGAHVAVGAMGQAVGKSGGKVVGKQVVKVVGKKAAKKLGKKALKCIPFIGTVVSVGCAIWTIADDPSDGRNWVLAVSDVGTSFLGPVGVVVDVGVSSAVEYSKSCD